MGRIKQGVLGGFSGKAGSVIGSNWKDIDYIRGLSKRKPKAPTMLQLQQQAKFALTARFLKPIKDLLNVTCDGLKSGRAMGFNMVLKQVIGSAITGQYPDYAINYAVVKLAYGSLAIAKGSVAAEAGAILRITWKNQTNPENGFGDDRITVLIYEPETNIYTRGLEDKTRADGEMEVSLGDDMVGQTLHVYYFFVGRDGKKLSDSFYAGEVVVI